MISFLRGILVEKTPTYVVIEVQGVGFKLWIPLSSYTVLGEAGTEVRVLSYLHAREDAIQLFGFATTGERDLFLMLIAVSGVGPKLAQGILSGIAVEDFKRAVRSHDVAALTQAPGVGKKTAERLVLELKDKVGDGGSDDTLPSTLAPTGEEAVMALVSLGYKKSRAQDAVQRVLNADAAASVEETIRMALRRM